MALNNALLISQVSHARQRPKKNAFRYSVYYLCMNVAAWPALDGLWPFSRERWNLFSLWEKDFGRGQSPEAWIRGLLREWNVTEADGDIVLMTMPRVLGYAFNPVSFWFCLDKQGQLRAVLADVTNTFGERHAYLLHHDDGRVMGSDDWFTSTKQFHVSPFIEVNGRYEFRFVYSEDKIGVWINHHDDEGLLLTTSVTGKRKPLTSRSLMESFFRTPLVTVKVIGLIHLQAFKLFLKGIRYRVKPTPPSTEISR